MLFERLFLGVTPKTTEELAVLIRLLADAFDVTLLSKDFSFGHVSARIKLIDKK